MKKAFVFALTALIIAMTATGCGNEAKTDTSKSTADEASYSTTAVAEVTTTTNDQTTTGIEPSGTGRTEPTVPTTVKPKTNSDSESSKSNQSSASQTSDHKPAEQPSASGNSSPAQSHSSNQTSAPNQSHSGGQSSSSSQTSNKGPSVSDPNEGKTWHNAVYKTINHPAETKEVKDLPSATLTRARRGTMRFTKQSIILLKPKRSRSSIRKHTPMTNRFTVGALSVMCAEQILQKTAKAT